MNSFPHVFQFPAYSFYRSDTEFNLKGKWNKDFFQNDFPIILELGCGKGEYTIGLAELYPEKNIIGIDIKGARMWTGAKYSFEKQMKNVAFLRTNIEAVHYFFGENEVSEIWLPFPDPQMKKVRKRLTSTHFMKIYQQFVKPSGLIHLKTDSNFMFTYTCEMVKINHYPVRYITEDVYNSDNNDPALKIQTFYESQWIERGLKIKYLQFNLEKRETFFEPDIEIERDTYRSFGRNKN